MKSIVLEAAKGFLNEDVGNAAINSILERLESIRSEAKKELDGDLPETEDALRLLDKAKTAVMMAGMAARRKGKNNVVSEPQKSTEQPANKTDELISIEINKLEDAKKKHAVIDETVPVDAAEKEFQAMVRSKRFGRDLEGASKHITVLMLAGGKPIKRSAVRNERNGVIFIFKPDSKGGAKYLALRRPPFTGTLQTIDEAVTWKTGTDVSQHFDASRKEAIDKIKKAMVQYSHNPTSSLKILRGIRIVVQKGTAYLDTGVGLISIPRDRASKELYDLIDQYSHWIKKDSLNHWLAKGSPLSFQKNVTS